MVSTVCHCICVPQTIPTNQTAVSRRLHTVRVDNDQERLNIIGNIAQHNVIATAKSQPFSRRAV